MNGIDVSHYQGKIDYKKASNNLDFVILKATQGTTYTDPTFDDNYNGFKDIVDVGAYIFINATTIAEAKAEAQHFSDVAKGKKLPAGVWLDLEDKKIIGADLTSIIYAEAELLRENGFGVGLYCNVDWYTRKLDSKTLCNDFVFWIARYSTKAEHNPFKNQPNCVIWQYSSKGDVEGINGNVDMDVSEYKVKDIMTMYGGAKTKKKDTYVGSARIGENGKATGGKAGDQKQKYDIDAEGEVSIQPMYNHSKGWYVLRPRSSLLALKLGERMSKACMNYHIGYNQNERLGVVEKGIDTITDTNCDCSSLVRECVKEASGIDAGNFTTANETTALLSTNLFEGMFKYTSKTQLFVGDILVTCTKGHTAIVVYGEEREESDLYPQYTGSSSSIVSVLVAIGELDTGFVHRKEIAINNGVNNYIGTADQNLTLVRLAKEGILKR